MDAALAWLIVAGLLAAYLWYIRGGDIMAAPRAAAGASERVARYRRWLRRAPLAFGLSSLVALAITGRLDALVHLPAELAEAAVDARRLAGSGSGSSAFKLAVLGGFSGGVLLGLAIAWWRKRRGRRQLMAGNLDAILPRGRVELAWTSLLALVAGMVEELFFRLALPLAATLATGSAEAGLALGLVTFVLAHRYQGCTGMVFSGVAGALLAILYLATGSLWFAMLVHALLNLNGLVIRPAVIGSDTR